MCFRYGRGVEEAFHRRGGYVYGIYCGLWRDGIAGFVFPQHFHVAEKISMLFYGLYPPWASGFRTRPLCAGSVSWIPDRVWYLGAPRGI